MPNHLHPSLDTNGWIDTPIETIDAMLSHFFLSDYSQTHCFPGGVSSFAWIIQNNQPDLDRTISVLQATLHRYFSKQFQTVEVEVGEVPNETSINKKQLSLYLTLSDKDGQVFNLNRIIDYTNLKVVEIINTVNFG